MNAAIASFWITLVLIFLLMGWLRLRRRRRLAAAWKRQLHSTHPPAPKLTPDPEPETYWPAIGSSNDAGEPEEQPEEQPEGNYEMDDSEWLAVTACQNGSINIEIRETDDDSVQNSVNLNLEEAERHARMVLAICAAIRAQSGTIDGTAA